MSQQSIIYDLLVSPRFKTARYITLLVFFIIVSLNQAFTGYKDFIPQMGNTVYWIIIGTISTYAATVSLFFKRILKGLLTGKYAQFVLCTVACAIFFTAIPNFVYATYMDNYDLATFIIDNLSTFTVYLLCISGIFIPVFIKNWLRSNQRLNYLKIKQKTSRIEQLKEQINPSSFFEVLRKSRSLVKSEPEKASDMLMKLGQLLRYQLYDCNRTQVLLNAEINFLRNFLELKQLRSPAFTYSMTTTGDPNGVFMAPTLLLPYIQSLIHETENSKDPQNIAIQIGCSNNIISIVLTLSGDDSVDTIEKKLIKVKERLGTLYGSHYELSVYGNKPAKKTVSLNLERI